MVNDNITKTLLTNAIEIGEIYHKHWQLNTATPQLLTAVDQLNAANYQSLLANDSVKNNAKLQTRIHAYVYNIKDVAMLQPAVGWLYYFVELLPTDIDTLSQLQLTQWETFVVKKYLQISPMSRTQDITKAINQAIQRYLQWCLNSNHLDDPTKDEPDHPYLYQCWRHSWTQYQKISDQHRFQ